MKSLKRWSILAVVALLLVGQGALCFAEDANESLFQKANEAYSRGDFQQAIILYQELTAASGYSPAVLYNLANSHAQAGETGRAVLNYERALRLSPSDSDIKGNLDLVRKESGLFPTELDVATRFFQLLTLHQWATLALLALAGFTIFQAITLRYRPGSRTAAGARIACILVLGVAVTGTAVRYQHFNPAVVVEDDARLLISPFTSATSVGTIQEGRLVYPQKSHGSFTLVRDETNRQGWLVSSALEPVIKTGSGLTNGHSPFKS